MKSYAAPLLLVPLLAGCAMIQGGTGSFTADGDTYKVSKVTCTRQGDAVQVAAESGVAAATVTVRGSTVEDLRMGTKQRPTMGAVPGQGIGEASVTVTGQRYEVRAKLVKADPEGRVQPGPGTEEVTFDVTCGTITG